MMRARDLLVGLATVLAACGSTDPGPFDGLEDVVVDHPDVPPIAPFDRCTVRTARMPAESRNHVTPCSPLDYPFHPPASGDHYEVWADFGTYDAPVPSGYLVHSLEHGAVELFYDCASGCPDVTDELAAIVTDHGVDPTCSGVDSRFIVAPDPELGVAVAAVAWEHLYLATCLDPPSLRAFVEEHYAMGPEDLCARGLDDSARGWCD